MMADIEEYIRDETLKLVGYNIRLILSATTSRCEEII